MEIALHHDVRPQLAHQRQARDETPTTSRDSTAHAMPCETLSRRAILWRSLWRGGHPCGLAGRAPARAWITGKFINHSVARLIGTMALATRFHFAGVCRVLKGPATAFPKLPSYAVVAALLLAQSSFPAMAQERGSPPQAQERGDKGDRGSTAQTGTPGTSGAGRAKGRPAQGRRKPRTAKGRPGAEAARG
jgi:hypothetical protein